MKKMTKAVLAALALTGAAMAMSAPAKAQVSAYVGVGGDSGFGAYYESDSYADPYYAAPYADAYDSNYADPYACDYYDYYEPPWGYPPDYCNYQVWTQPVYASGLWYGGPIYYRSYSGVNWFWLNGGWRRDEWRGSRPGRIDWSRNRYWSGQIHHRPNSRGVWNGRSWNGNGFVGGNYNRGNYNRGNWNGRDGNGRDGNRGRDFSGRSWNGGNNFAGRNWNGGGTVKRGGDGARGRDLGPRANAPNAVAPQNGRQGGDFRGRTGGNFRGRESGGQAFVQPGVASNNNNGALRGRFGGQTFQARNPRAEAQQGGFRGANRGGGDAAAGLRGANRGGGNTGAGVRGGNRGERGGERGQGRRGTD